MRALRWLYRLFTSTNARPEVVVSMVLGSGYNADKPIDRMVDLQLTDHFSLFELTVTLNAALRERNRRISDAQLQKLTRLARHGEGIRAICGAPVIVHSGYRCPELNGQTAGASSTSQHPRCEALDFHISGQDVEETFMRLRAEAAAGRWAFGQLIIEEAKRDYGIARWIHASVVGTLDPSKVGQVLRMASGEYHLVERIKFQPLTI